MCMIEDGDGYVTVLSTAMRLSAKERTCDECRRGIQVGEMYRLENVVWEDEFQKWNLCPQCLIVRKWLQDECGGWVYGGLEEDLTEHLGEVDPRMWFGLARLVVGMRQKWRNRKMPRLPLTTCDIRKLALAQGGSPA